MRYHHDCSHCVLLGSIYIEGEYFDLYFCSQGSLKLPTVLARYGDEESNYFSGLSFSGLSFSEFHPALAEAKNLAEQRGLI